MISFSLESTQNRKSTKSRRIDAEPARPASTRDVTDKCELLAATLEWPDVVFLTLARTLLQLWLGRCDGAEHVTISLAVRPCAGVFVAIDHHMRAEGAEPGQSQVVEGDDRRVACPLDRDRHRQRHIMLAVFDPRGEHPQVALRHLPHRVDGVRLCARRCLPPGDGELTAQHGVAQRRFKLLEQAGLADRCWLWLGDWFIGIDFGQSDDQRRDTASTTNQICMHGPTLALTRGQHKQEEEDVVLWVAS